MESSKWCVGLQLKINKNNFKKNVLIKFKKLLRKYTIQTKVQIILKQKLIFNVNKSVGSWSSKLIMKSYVYNNRL